MLIFKVNDNANIILFRGIGAGVYSNHRLNYNIYMAGANGELLHINELNSFSYLKTIGSFYKEYESVATAVCLLQSALTHQRQINHDKERR
jgi:hypothetical protein